MILIAQIYGDLKYRDYEITDLMIKLDTLQMDLELASDFPKEFQEAIQKLIKDVENELDYRSSKNFKKNINK